MLISNKKGVVIWRQSPSKRMIRVRTLNIYGNWELNSYFLSFPFIFYKIKYSFVKRTFLDVILFRKRKRKLIFKQLSIAFSVEGNLNDLFKPPLYNIYRDMKCCMGKHKFSYFKNVDDLIKNVINYFWSTDYNQEINHMIQQYSDNEKLLHIFRIWQEKTKKHPNWMPNEKDLLVLDLHEFEES